MSTAPKNPFAPKTQRVSVVIGGRTVRLELSLSSIHQAVLEIDRSNGAGDSIDSMHTMIDALVSVDPECCASCGFVADGPGELAPATSPDGEIEILVCADCGPAWF